VADPAPVPVLDVQYDLAAPAAQIAQGQVRDYSRFLTYEHSRITIFVYMLIALRVACAVSALCCSVARSQSFDAASIKPAPQRGSVRMQGGPRTSDPSRIRYSDLNLRYLVMVAYRIGGFQLSAPAWLDGKTFDVVATLPPGATKAQLRTMLQNLLTERFRLALHREQRIMPTYTLIVGKNGPQLKQISIPCRRDLRMNWNWTAAGIRWFRPARGRGWWRCETATRVCASSTRP
jgi:hypothetical protein